MYIHDKPCKGHLCNDCLQQNHRLDLVEQADVLDRNHGLIGEGLQQGDLLVAERVHLSPTENDCPNALRFVHQWDTQNCPVVLCAAQLPRFREFITF